MTHRCRLTRTATLTVLLATPLPLGCSGDGGSSTTSETASSDAASDPTSAGPTGSSGATQTGTQTGSGSDATSTATSSPTSGSTSSPTSSSTSSPTSSSDTVSTTDPGTTSTTHGVDTCQDAEAQVAGFLNKNQPCLEDSDCVMVDAGCWPEQQDCCVLYLNMSHDVATWEFVYNQFIDLCGADECGCCAAIPADPGCVDNVCGPKQG